MARHCVGLPVSAPQHELACLPQQFPRLSCGPSSASPVGRTMSKRSGAIGRGRLLPSLVLGRHKLFAINTRRLEMAPQERRPPVLYICPVLFDLSRPLHLSRPIRSFRPIRSSRPFRSFRLFGSFRPILSSVQLQIPETIASHAKQMRLHSHRNS